MINNLNNKHIIDIDEIEDNYSKSILYFLSGLNDIIKINDSVKENIRIILSSTSITTELNNTLLEDISDNEIGFTSCEYNIINNGYHNSIFKSTDDKIIYDYDEYDNIIRNKIDLLALNDMLYKLTDKNCDIIEKIIIVNDLRLKVSLIISEINHYLVSRDLFFDKKININSSYISGELLMVYLKRYYDFFHLDYNNYLDEKSISILNIDFKILSLFTKNLLLYIQIQQSIIAYLKSPFYKDKHKNVLFEVFSLFKDIIGNSNINGLFINSNNSFLDIPIVDRGKTNNTTALEFFFALPNKNSYCLRIDFPHGDEPNLHINLSDFDGECAIPLTITEFSELKNDLGINDIGLFYDLFYENGTNVWFTNNFLGKLYKTDLNKETKNKLETLFKSQSHYEIKSAKNINENDLFCIFQDLNKFFVGLPTNQIPKNGIPDEIGFLYKTKLINYISDDIYYYIFILINKGLLSELDNHTINNFINIESILKNKIINYLVNNKSINYSTYSKEELEQFDIHDLLEHILDDIILS